MGDESKAVRTVETGEHKDRILIVEDEDNARKGYEQLLQRWGYEVLGVNTAEDALAKFSNFQPDTLIADVELPGMNGLDLLKQLGEELHDVPAIIITGKGSEERAVAAIESGAFWYIEKPLKGPVLRALLDRALSKAHDARNLVVLQRQLREAGRLGDIVGNSKPMQEVMRIIEMAAPSSASVLITGETGSGKEIVARTIHKLSPRAVGPFVAINCSAIPETLMESDSPRAVGPFVAINCSAIPETLMESEIFGHERGTSVARSRAPRNAASAASNWPTAARCCSTKLAKCQRRRRRSCCACWKTARCGGSAAKRKRPWTFACSRRPTKILSSPWPTAVCARTSISG